MSKSASRPLKLKATDVADMMVFASLVQDGILRLRDMRFLKDEGRFVGVINRIRWEEIALEDREALRAKVQTDDDRDAAFEDVDADGGAVQRQHLGFTFEHVTWVAQKNLPTDRDSFLTLLTISATDEATTLHFAEDRAIRLAHRKIALFAEDLGDAWPTFYLPDHDSDQPKGPSA